MEKARVLRRKERYNLSFRTTNFLDHQPWTLGKENLARKAVNRFLTLHQVNFCRGPSAPSCPFSGWQGDQEPSSAWLARWCSLPRCLWSPGDRCSPVDEKKERFKFENDNCVDAKYPHSLKNFWWSSIFLKFSFILLTVDQSWSTPKHIWLCTIPRLCRNNTTCSSAGQGDN